MSPSNATGPSSWELVQRWMTSGYDRMRWMAEDLARHGPVVRYRVPGRPIFLVAEPELARQILERRAGRYRRGPFLSRFGRLFGRGLLTSEGELHRTQRRTILPALQRGALGGALRAAATEAGQLARRWSGSGAQAREVSGELRQLTLRVIVRGLFGPVPEPWYEALDEAFATTRDEVHRRILSPLPWPEWLPLPAHRRLARAIDRLDCLVAERIAARVANPQERPDEDAGDLLSHLLSKPGADSTLVRDELLTLLQAGHLTTAVALAWSLALLAHHPEVASRTTAEIRSLPPCTWDEPEKLRALPLLGRVVDEALRLYPPVWLVDRACVEEDELAGAEVPIGALVLVSPFFLHRRPEDWPEPDRFDPERFVHAPRPGSYLPFGAGPRGCVGASLARAELISVLATLLAAHRFTPAGPFPTIRAQLLVDLEAGLRLTIEPHGMN